MPWLRNPDTAFPLAGHLDVVLFFVLSGDALSFPFFHGGGTRYLQRAAPKRYPRLAVPIVVVTAATALLMAAGASAARFAFFVHLGGYRANDLPFLWTMPIALLGSFVLLLVHPRVRGAGWIVAGLAVPPSGRSPSTPRRWWSPSRGGRRSSRTGRGA